MLPFRRRPASGPPTADRLLGYDRAELDAQYDLLTRHGDSLPVFHKLTQTLSDRARAVLSHERDVAYGDEPRMTMDLYPAPRPGAPVIGFLHGGYWRLQDKRDANFVALGLVPHGCAVAIINTGQAPETPIAGIVDHARLAALWLQRHARRLNGDDARVFLVGHGAGGHLAAMTLTTDWSTLGADVPQGGPVAGIVALSGLFDLEPIRASFLNAELDLDLAAATQLSPLRLAPAVRQPSPAVLLAVGEKESDEYHRQFSAYARALDSHGVAFSGLTLAGHHHFSAVAELANPASEFTKRVIGLVGPAAAAVGAPI